MKIIIDHNLTSNDNENTIKIIGSDKMRDMTKGNIYRHLMSYAIPLLLGNWFQMGYNAIDSMIVGRFISKDALAAVGIASPTMNFMILGSSGLCIGAGILMSQFYGAKDFKQLRLQLSTTLISGTILSLIIGLCGVLCMNIILNLLMVPKGIYMMTKQYLLIVFMSVPFTFLYNAFSQALKSVGDSKTPLKFLMITSILNGVLDIILIGYFRFGILCSALTTLLCQLLSALMCYLYFKQYVPRLWPNKDEWQMNSLLLKKTMQYGGVTALQQSIQPIGKLMIQSQVNALGVNVIAAFNAVTRVDDFAFTPEQNIAAALTTFIAQNKGANKKDRITTGFKVGMILEIFYWLLIGTITMKFKEDIMYLFVGNEQDVIQIGVEYLSLMAIFYLWPALTNGIQGFFRGIGKLKITVLGTFIQTSIRVISTYLLAPLFSIKGIAFSCVLGWSCMLLIEVPICLKEIKNNYIMKI